MENIVEKFSQKVHVQNCEEDMFQMLSEKSHKEI